MPQNEEETTGKQEGGPEPTEASALLEDVGIASKETIATRRHTVGLFAAFNIVFGLVCLIFPMLASETMEFFLTSAIFVAGCYNLTMFFSTTSKKQDEDDSSSRDDGDDFNELQYIAFGVIQILLALFLYVHKFGTYTVLTIALAIAYIAAGLYEIYLARNKENMAAKGLIKWSGAFSVAASLILVCCLPLTSWATIGILLGINHLSIGISRIILTWYGHRIAMADSKSEEEEAKDSLPEWMA